MRRLCVQIILFVFIFYRDNYREGSLIFKNYLVTTTISRLTGRASTIKVGRNAFVLIFYDTNIIYDTIAFKEAIPVHPFFILDSVYLTYYLIFVTAISAEPILCGAV